MMFCRNSLQCGAKPALILSRFLAVTGRHSKQVAVKKNKADAAKSKAFVRLGVKIFMAAKAGGIDPSINHDLARVLKEGQSVNLPKDNIDRALKKASDTSVENFTSGVYEIFGVGGVGLVVASLTDNTNRTVNNIKALARKADVKIAGAGSVLFKFDHKAVFTPTAAYDKDAVLEQALTVDISDVQFVPPNVADAHGEPEMIVVNANELGLLQDAVSQMDLPGSSSLAYLPTELVNVSDEDAQRNFDLIDSLEDLDDVDVVYHNMLIE